MAVVIPFAPRRRPPDGVPESDRTQGAILFFTGVRYERHAEPVAGIQPPPRPLAASGAPGKPATRAKRLRQPV